MPAFQPAPGALPPGCRVYAIGDIHGCDTALAALHQKIAADLARRPVPHPLLLHIGDYVDRGPDSAAVLARLAAGPPLPGVPTVSLMGNHEHMMLEALDGDRTAANDWLFNGGARTLASWGADPLGPRDAWKAAVPPEQLAFVRGLALSHHQGSYLFVHAGIRPGIPLARQAPADLLWIRGPFLHATQNFGAIVVHGHTPQTQPVVRPNRIGIDTGAVYGGKLTCVVLEDDRLAFLQVS